MANDKSTFDNIEDALKAVAALERTKTFGMGRYGIPVSTVKASQEWLDRVEENPANYTTPERRLILQFPREISPWPIRGMAFVQIGDITVILDERTDEEIAADDERFRPTPDDSKLAEYV
jgi:hypothetical protein